MRQPLFTDTLQVAFIVRDLDAAMRTYVEQYGIGPWKVFHFDETNAADTVKDDQPATYAMRIAIADVGRVQWELIEPLDDKSHYADFLAEKGEGIHHLQMAVSNYDDAVAELRGRGHRVLVGGKFDGTDLVYLGTQDEIGVITEIVDRDSPNGGADHEPIAIYPASEE
jgi:catechol 2,3-dioxygenase-like lactoylglutathione lyase family enzyme